MGFSAGKSAWTASRWTEIFRTLSDGWIHSGTRSSVRSCWLESKVTSDKDRLLPEQLQAIGEVATQWSILENTVHFAFWQIIDLPMEVGRLIAVHIRRVEVLLSIIEGSGAIPAHRLDEWKQLRRKIRFLGECRDQIVHRMWWRDVTTQEMRGLMPTSRKGLNAPSIPMSPAEMEDLALQINHAERSLAFFAIETHLARRPSAP